MRTTATINDRPASAATHCSASVLDACCGSRMFWFDRRDSRAVFVDKRRERHTLKDKSSTGGSRELIVDPDLQADFTDLPFADGQFSLVVFDPPHLVRNGRRGWLAKKYGKLEGDWKQELSDGFKECFRVLRMPSRCLATVAARPRSHTGSCSSSKQNAWHNRAAQKTSKAPAGNTPLRLVPLFCGENGVW